MKKRHLVKLAALFAIILCTGIAIRQIGHSPKRFSIPVTCSEPYWVEQISPSCVEVTSEENAIGSKLIKVANRCTDAITIQGLRNDGYPYLEFASVPPLKLGKMKEAASETTLPRSQQSCLNVSVGSHTKCDKFTLLPDYYLKFTVGRDMQSILWAELKPSLLSDGQIQIKVFGPSGPHC